MTIDSIGNVAILETLGSGANSTIFRVRREADSREYALKVVPIESDDDKKLLEQQKARDEALKKLQEGAN